MARGVGRHPTEVMAELNTAINNALAEDDILHRVAAAGTMTLPGRAKAYAADIARE
jgi:hypothetical protein